MFEIYGFFKEYYINGKFIGTIKSDKDRELIGYNGRKFEVLSDKLILDNKKIIKKNTSVMTILYPLNKRIT